MIARQAPPKPATIDDAKIFSDKLCLQLGLPAQSGLAAYEDAAHFILLEQKLPSNLSLADAALEDDMERERIVRVLDHGLATPQCYILPIQAWQTQDRSRRWVTEVWKSRRERLYLAPGDSPAGFRLPIPSLETLDPVDFPHVVARDAFEPGAALPERTVLLHQRRTATLNPPAGSAKSNGPVRTAMTIEPRGGQLCIFMPPLSDAEDYAAMIAAVEETASSLGRPVHIEGYSPPDDVRLNVIKVTPDPGVIEVNVHPAGSWSDAVAITTAVYEEAHASRLCAEKFMLDGRHTGTGGGNHIVLGGFKAEDSPFLRRPDMLASIITYWQNHPSLSYLFSGMFIGPTSQAPRVDEARHESLYELEIALAQIPDPSQGTVAPWLVDRIFRHLLIDVTGNTHRAEICIDKLYSPDSATGRLGLIEFRSFEMPPHARMSLAQQLLLRALVAMFWEKPYKQKLVRWGTSLHDRFMLPHFVWSDFASVITDLKDANLPVELEWFRPHYEFRFPSLGQTTALGVAIELRQALEPWHVLGEEGTAGGTARYVDSSLERVQVLAKGLSGDRFRVTCNGRALPLTGTGTAGEAVAGVRFRAWAPPSALHPTIPTHVPLTFDIVDTWSGRSVGGCRYHVSHPGGRSAEHFPVNMYEAEGRRLARFEALGHTAGAMNPKPPDINIEYPYTLDLRR